MTAPRQGGVTSAKSTVNLGSFVVDPTFLQSQTIRVFVRLKPLEEEPSGDNKKSRESKRAWNIQKTGALETLVQKGTARKVEGRTVFHFDQVFDEDAKTPLLYKSIARSMVHTVMDGKHATIFAYGQTGSGKTYTMQGDGKAQSGQAGIIQLVVSDLFRFSRMGAQSSREFVIKVSYVEVYNERVRDLLAEDAGDNASQGTPQGTPVLLNVPEVHIRTSATGEVTMNCITKQVHTVEDVLELLIYGNSNRVVAKTDMNNHSSRSHAIFRLTVQSAEKGLGIGADVVRIGDFNLVDLAGSESTKQSSSNGKRQKEGAKINQSLLSLSNVINALSQPDKKRPKHINFRDSKLTRILQPHLSGNAEMAIICCACPTKAFIEETRSTLKFGARAKLVTVAPKVNELNDDSALIKKLQAELELAKQQLEDYKRSGVPADQRIKAPNRIDPVKHHANPTVDDDDVSYGYDDMDAGPGHREYDFVSNQELPPPAQFEEGETVPGMGGRAYVMPKNQELPPELQRDFGADGENVSPLPLPNREYVIPKNRALTDIPLGLGNEFENKESGTESDDDMSEDVVSMDELHNSTVFQLDAVDPADAKAVNRYLEGKKRSDVSFANESDLESDNGATGSSGRGGSRPKKQMADFGKNGSKHDQTGPTEDESLDGPESSYAAVSQKFGSAMSKPDTMRATSTKGARSKLASVGSVDNFHVRHGTRVSWDTMDLDTMQPEQVGRPLKAIQSLYRREIPLPEEITIMRVAVTDDNKGNMCLTDKLNETEARAAFLQNRLEMADDLVEGIFKDLERARLCIHDLVYRNAQLSAKLKEKHRDDLKEDYQAKEVAVEQYWLLKGAMYIGLFFFISGGYEFFMATVFLVWLILEINLGTLT